MIAPRIWRKFQFARPCVRLATVPLRPTAAPASCAIVEVTNSANRCNPALFLENLRLDTPRHSAYHLRVKRFAILLALVSVWTPTLAQKPPASSATSASAKPALTISGDVSQNLSLSLADLAALPRKTIKVSNQHSGKQETYEGVALAELFKRAGVPQGEQLRGPDLAAYVRAEGADGYVVTFGLAELDASFQDSEVLVADSLDGQPLGDKVGPLRLIVPQDKRPGRWVRMLRSISVVKISK